jgi:hypothetical protein
MRRIFSLSVMAISLAAGVWADSINFQSQLSASTATWFDGTLDSPLTISTATNTATFLGGQLLNHQFLGADQSVVYATESGSVYSDPITINFAQAVNEISIDITNELSFDHTYVVTDNLGHSVSQVILFDHTVSFNLADAGITSVTVGSLPTSGNWIYAIDNVSFDTSVPENPSVTLLLLGLIGTGFLSVLSRRTA